MSSQLQAQLRNAHRLLSSGKRADAIPILRALLDDRAAAPYHGDIALLLMRAGDYDSSLRAARELVAAFPDNVEAISLLANLLANVGELDEAIALAKKVCRELPDNPDTHYNLGIYLSRDGRNDRALESFAKAVALDPNHALSLEYLAYLDPGQSADVILEQIESCLSGTGVRNAASQAALQYGKAVLLDRRKSYEQAFAAYEAGAQLMHGIGRMDMATAEHVADTLKKSFSAGFFEQNSRHRHDNERPIFIVGMPRSGTTLVESVFASHSRVKAGGETKLLGLATMRHDPFAPANIAQIDTEVAAGETPWVDMGRELARLHDQRHGPDGRVTEKNLGHHFLLGVIAMIASGAPIIYCTRDPVATAWSSYKVRFSSGNGWSYDFASIARYQRLYRDLMSHWQRVLPDAPIMELAYEDLVNDPGKTIPRLLAHAQLDMEPACLAPHRASMPVMTASVAQVREPIRTDANLAWRNYESHLAPYLDDLRGTGDD